MTPELWLSGFPRAGPRATSVAVVVSGLGLASAVLGLVVVPLHLVSRPGEPS